MRTELYDQDGKGTRKFVLLATYKPAVTSRNGMEWGYRSAVYGFEKLCFGEILCILELQKEKLKTNSWKAIKGIFTASLERTRSQSEFPKD